MSQDTDTISSKELEEILNTDDHLKKWLEKHNFSLGSFSIDQCLITVKGYREDGKQITQRVSVFLSNALGPGHRTDERNYRPLHKLFSEGKYGRMTMKDLLSNTPEEVKKFPTLGKERFEYLLFLIEKHRYFNPTVWPLTKK